MVAAQLDLFAETQFGAQAREITRSEQWAQLGYDGPAPGRLCDIDSCIADLEKGGVIYSIFEQCRLIERRPDGRWLAEIAMGEVHGKQWSKDGTRVLLAEDDIWPPMRLPEDQRNDIFTRGKE
jgi:hypothetical protein